MFTDPVDDVAIDKSVFGCVVDLQSNTPFKPLYLDSKVGKFFDDGIAVVAFRTGI